MSSNECPGDPMWQTVACDGTCQPGTTHRDLLEEWNEVDYTWGAEQRSSGGPFYYTVVQPFETGNVRATAIAVYDATDTVRDLMVVDMNGSHHLLRWGGGTCQPGTKPPALSSNPQRVPVSYFAVVGHYGYDAKPDAGAAVAAAQERITTTEYEHLLVDTRAFVELRVSDSKGDRPLQRWEVFSDFTLWPMPRGGGEALAEHERASEFRRTTVKSEVRE